MPSSLLTLSEQTKQMVKIAQALAKECQNAQFTLGHLLHALLQRDIRAGGLLVIL